MSTFVIAANDVLSVVVFPFNKLQMTSEQVFSLIRKFMNIQTLIYVVMSISLETHHKVTISLETSLQATNPVRD